MDSEGDAGTKNLKQTNLQVCQICSDEIGTTVDGEPFVACHVCAFPVCRPCYEYERKDGNQSCPQCKTKYKRHKGSSKPFIAPFTFNAYRDTKQQINFGC
uniref:Uncharacterized protein MANES_09G023700 n=1 Tax=Rhizophora mucronata TaxID=61149 RepID=A0A2P2MP60_RHIMU